MPPAEVPTIKSTCSRKSGSWAKILERRATVRMPDRVKKEGSEREIEKECGRVRERVCVSGRD